MQVAVRTARRPAPQLPGAALDAVRHRGSHLQLIAGAGSGKTEVVARVVDLLAEAASAESIIALTFTERTAEELTSLVVGTIHAYCFRLLQQRDPRYERTFPTTTA
jgi:DNA helicase-2/ATP-dependent DNA helicase PcrA